MKLTTNAIIWSIAMASGLITSAAYSAEFDIGYDTKYVSEGRDNLVDGGIVWFSAGTELDENFSVIAAYGNATSSKVDYDELNLGLAYANSVDDIDYYVAYTRLEFFEDGESDNEIGFGVAWNAFESFTPFADYVYSTEADGSFVELGVETEIQINEQLSLTPYIIIDFDFGYATKENHGHNHSGIGAVLSYALNDIMTISLIAEHTIGAGDVKADGGENNQTWAGLHFTAAL